VLIITLAVLAGLLAMASQGMDTSDFVITLLRGLSVGALTFLVASGFSLIFGLLDVLNLAHGTLFMIGAYVGWTVYVRPDTFVDLVTPLALLISGFVLAELWRALAARWATAGCASLRRGLGWPPPRCSCSTSCPAIRLRSGTWTITPKARFPIRWPPARAT
jgi:branched-chain amino acid transport system permease protein